MEDLNLKVPVYYWIACLHKTDMGSNSVHPTVLCPIALGDIVQLVDAKPVCAVLDSIVNRLSQYHLIITLLYEICRG
jgi:hypothetical protein